VSAGCWPASSAVNGCDLLQRFLLGVDTQPHLDHPGGDHQDRADDVADGQLRAFPDVIRTPNSTGPEILPAALWPQALQVSAKLPM
jgi:hypothetical protein